MLKYQDDITKEDILRYPHWVYLGNDIEWLIKMDREVGRERRYSTGTSFDYIARDYRKKYIDMIGRLSVINAPTNPLLWWSSELAAKNPYNGLYDNICLELVYKGFVGSAGDGLLYVRSKGQRKPPRDSFDMFPIFPGAGLISKRYARYVGTRTDYRHGVLTSIPINRFSGEKTALFFTWADERNITRDGKYKDPFFGDLPFRLREKGYDVAFIARVLPIVDFKQMVSRLAETGENIFFPEQFIDGKDWLNCRVMADVFNPELPDDIMLCGIDVRPLIKNHVNVMRGNHARALLYNPMIRKMADAEIVPSRIYFPCEGHAWETCMLHSIRQYMPETKIIGFDIGTSSTMFLSMYPSSIESPIRPMPDKIVVGGSIYADALRSGGYPEGLIVEGCALRQPYLSDVSLKNGSTTNDRPFNVLVATSIGYEESLEIIYKARLAFAMDPRYNVVVKLHPQINKKKIFDVLGDGFIISDASLGTLLAESDILLHTSTSASIEALAHGVFPICVLRDCAISLDKLDTIPFIGPSAATPELIKEAAESFLEMPSESKTEWMQKAKEVSERCFGKVTDECIARFE